MSDLEIRWPDADLERIEAARGRLEVARERLAARGPDAVLAVLAEVFDRWRADDSPWRARLVEEHAAATGFSPAVVEAGLALGLASWTGAAFREAVEGEQRALLAAGGRRLRPFASTSIVLAGAIPMPSLLQPALSLATGSPVLVRPASRDPITPRRLADSIRAVDEDVGGAIEVVSFPTDDPAALDRFLAAECVVASGSDETIAAIGGRLDPGRRFVAYGHRLSVAVIDDAAVDRDRVALAEAVARDVALWDQQGCLSPCAVYAVGPRAEETSRRFAEALAEALEALATAWPRGEVEPATAAAIVHERDAAAMRAAGGAAVGVHAGPGTTWTVVAEADARWRPCPLGRFVRVHPVADGPALEAALRPVAPFLSSAGLGAAGAERDALAARLVALGASRIARPGRMQAPPIDWPHDGRPILAPLFALASDEGAERA